MLLALLSMFPQHLKCGEFLPAGTEFWTILAVLLIDHEGSQGLRLPLPHKLGHAGRGVSLFGPRQEFGTGLVAE